MTEPASTVDARRQDGAAAVHEPPLTPYENQRLRAVRRLDLFGRSGVERFDRIARLAARVFDTPIALVTIIEDSEQWAVGCLGMRERLLPRARSFCAHALDNDHPLIVHDTLLDARFRRNPLVTGEPRVRFYAGQPARTASGFVVGTVCIMDTSRRDFSLEDTQALSDLGHMLEAEFGADELREAINARVAVEKRLRAVKDSVIEGVITVNDDGNVGYANPAALHLLALLKENIVGQRPPASLEPLVLEALAGATCRGTLELRKRGSDSLIEIEYAASPVAPPGEGAVVVFRDVSERRTIELMRERLISTVSHEFRTPLTAVIGYLEALVDGDAGDLSPVQVRHVEVAYRNALRLRELTEDLLLASEVEARSSGADEPIELRSVVEEVSQALLRARDARDVTLSVDMESLAVLGDPRRLRQVIGNLLSNAIKFSPEGGPVTVRGWWDGDFAVVEVTDNGPGVPPAEIRHVGTRFFRASTAAGVPGTGLGISIAREIITQHGGTLAVDNGGGGGAVARLRLPRRPPAL